MKDVIKVFAIYVHATLSNRCVVHVFIMETNTRWKIAMCDIINFLVRNNIGRKHDNNTKSKIRKEVHLSINSNYIPCTLLLIAVIFGRWFLVQWTSTNLFLIPKKNDYFGMCWWRMSPQNMLKYPSWGYLNHVWHGWGCISFMTVCVRCTSYIWMKPMSKDVSAC